MAVEGPVFLTTFIEGILVHGQSTPFVLLVPCQHSPHRGLLMPPQMPWSPGFLPPALLQAQVDQHWKIPFRFVDKSTLPVVFDERTSRLPSPWLLRLESLEGQQRLYVSHLIRTKAPEEALPTPPEGGQWVSELGLPNMDLMPGVRRLCLAAIQAVKEG
ncbi:MAG: hypothetical protein HY823_09285 [Acidobacteria bacterium]|nr:hypothetical protein [Acidobacteriota bacterium]